MVERMRPGSVIVDLAAASGGNCELTVDGEEIDHGGVAGHRRRRPGLAASPTTASALYARNVSTFLGLLVHEGRVQPDFDDDIVAATCVTAGGAVRHAPTRELLDGSRPVTGGPLDILVIFVLAAFVGFEVISKVPSILHTPLMSGSNAIHGIILVGAMIVANEAHGALQIALALVAIILATLNIVGGVVVTDRMLEMFKGRDRSPPGGSPDRGSTGRPGQRPGRTTRARRLTASTIPNNALVGGYLIASICFIVALKALSSPRRARMGNLIGVGGMVVAVGLTLADEHAGPYGIIPIGMVVGAVIGAPVSRLVRMTAMPQLVAVFNGVGGGAAALVSMVTFLHVQPGHPSGLHVLELLFGLVIGAASFAGSLVAFAKLQELLTGRPITFPGQQWLHARRGRRHRRPGRVDDRRSPPGRASSCSACWLSAWAPASACPSAGPTRRSSSPCSTP